MKTLRLIALLLFSAVAASAHQVTLSCTPSTSQVVGYNAYRSIDGITFSKLNITPVPGCGYTDAGVVAGTTYIYVMTAVDSVGVESVYSNIATATIPVTAPGGVGVTVTENMEDEW